MSQDSLPDALVLVPVRWHPEQIARIEALHKRLGLPRSVLWRAAFDQGIGTLERSAAAVVGVGVASGTGEPV